MTTIDGGYAAALKAESALDVRTGAGASIWGDRGRSIAPLTPFDTPTGAGNEAARGLAFAGAPLARDVVIVTGQRRDLHLKCVTLEGKPLDYPVGVSAFVLGYEELDNDTTRLIVLRRVV